MYFLCLTWDVLFRKRSVVSPYLSNQHNLTQTSNIFPVWIFGLGFVRNSTGSVIRRQNLSASPFYSKIFKMPLKTTVIGAWPKVEVRRLGP